MTIVITDYVSDFIGLKMKVVEHSNPNNVGKSGKVIRETARTLVVDQGDSVVMIPKRTGKFSFTTQNRDFLIIGDYAMMRPEERLKNHRKISKNLRGLRGDRDY